MTGWRAQASILERRLVFDGHSGVTKIERDGGGGRMTADGRDMGVICDKTL